MQYEIRLPADYDMTIIRERVARRGHALDAFPGLGLKAYLIRERADGAAVNEYAPFYLWTEPAAMGRFLWGGAGFAGIIASFGRPVVRHWTGVAFATGPDAQAPPLWATRSTRPLDEADLPDDVVATELDAARHASGADGLHSVALAVDPHHWEAVRFALWSREPDEAAGRRYRVLHLSRPELDRLPEPDERTA
jgi:hypothetical protein